MEKWVDPIPALKRQLADEVLRELDGWSQSWGAWKGFIPRSRISNLRRGHLHQVSLERLILCLSRLGYRTEITLVKEPPKRGQWG